jgi:hypothetical protein
LIGFSKRCAIAGVVFSTLMVVMSEAYPQTPPSSPGNPVQPGKPDQPEPQQGAAATPSSPSGKADNPGVFNEIGKMFEKSLSILPPLKTPGETLDDWNARARDAAKDAGETLSRLAKPSMVTGRIICPVSANGAPDCKTASDKLCQAQGFKEGKSIGTDSTQTCSAKVLIPGRARKPDDCRTDTYVTRAFCQ